MRVAEERHAVAGAEAAARLAMIEKMEAGAASLRSQVRSCTL